MKYLKILFCLYLSGLSTIVNSDTLLLVHGYLSNANVWYESGVFARLEKNGWQYAGTLNAQGMVTSQALDSDKRFYTVNLPGDAPIQFQSKILTNMITSIVHMHPDDPLTLVGHSAGGIVARMSIVQTDIPAVTGLLTIATPHLGTEVAGVALHETSSSWPFSMIKSWVAGDIYDTVRRSNGLLVDMLPQNNSAMLTWLNTRKHPFIKYHSVIRMGDSVVPDFSQDMNNVLALKGRSTVILTRAPHRLVAGDGDTIARFVSE